MTRAAAAALAAALAVLAPAAAEEAFPACRAKLQNLLGQNVLHLRGEVEGESLLYRLWLDRDRWDGLGREGQDATAAMIRCSVTEGRNDRSFSLTVRSAFTNAVLARYEDDRLLPAEDGSVQQGESP